MVKDRILAAGGLLWRDSTRRELCLVHRPRYDDWSLPKGKLGSRERFLDGALREVVEETGYPVRVDGFAGEVYYEVEGRPKSVLFWHFIATADRPIAAPDAEEVGEVCWLEIDAALARMTYPDERRLVEESIRA